MGTITLPSVGKFLLFALALVGITALLIWSLGPIIAYFIGNAHAQGLGGLGSDPATFWQNVVTYGLTLGRSLTCVGAFWKACRLYMGHYDFQGVAMLGAGASIFFGVPVLLGVGGA